MNFDSAKVKKALTKLNEVCEAAGCDEEQCFDSCYIKVAEKALKIIDKKDKK